MNLNTEITLDFDNTVSTEDRFVIRHFIEDFVDVVNNQSQDILDKMISDSVIAEGFSEFVLQKKQLLEMFYKKFFGRRHNFIRFPDLKLSFNNSLYKVTGTYEEYTEEILGAVGSIEMFLLKDDEGIYSFVGFKFFPRMRMPMPETGQYD